MDRLTENYKKHVKTEREKSRFIYSIKNTSEEEGYYDCWSEIEFNTTRTFDNFFFDQKDFFLNKLNFFMQNNNKPIKESHVKVNIKIEFNSIIYYSL